MLIRAGAFCVTLGSHQQPVTQVNNSRSQAITEKLQVVTAFFESSSSKASRQLFIFVCLSKGYGHFQNPKVRIFWMPIRSSMLFLIVEAWLKVCGQSLHQVSTFEAELICKYVCTQVTFVLQVKGLLKWVRKDKQMLYTHTVRVEIKFT